MGVSFLYEWSVGARVARSGPAKQAGLPDAPSSERYKKTSSEPKGSVLQDAGLVTVSSHTLNACLLLGLCLTLFPGCEKPEAGSVALHRGPGDLGGTAGRARLCRGNRHDLRLRGRADSRQGTGLAALAELYGRLVREGRLVVVQDRPALLPGILRSDERRGGAPIAGRTHHVPPHWDGRDVHGGFAPLRVGRCEAAVRLEQRRSVNP